MVSAFGLSVALGEQGHKHEESEDHADGSSDYASDGQPSAFLFGQSLFSLLVELPKRQWAEDQRTDSKGR